MALGSWKYYYHRVLDSLKTSQGTQKDVIPITSFPRGAVN